MTPSNIPTFSYFRLWFGFIGSAITWVIHFFLIWFISEMGCLSGLGDQTLLGINSVVALILLMTIPLLLITVASGMLSYGIWRQIQDIERQSAPDQGIVYAALERQRFMAIFGSLAAILFGVIIMLQTVPLFTVPVCGA
ncbi:MAG: hypothetical protein CL607_18845 [Anaerolineaceae bacterium]|nr:hypothetical protein [Anaerolineaceae bacterium]